jgi:hypothetical protein
MEIIKFKFFIVCIANWFVYVLYLQYRIVKQFNFTENMETEAPNSDFIDEQQSLQVIREMIQVSQKKIRNDGILFILWGWISFINYFFLEYLTRVCITTHQIMQVVRPLRFILPVLGFAYTLYYILKQRKKVQTYIGISIRYVWFFLFISMVMINLILFNINHSINFELQHPIFMVLIAFAITVTGGILRYKMIIVGGIIFGILAVIASHFQLQEQLLAEAIAWDIAFIIPGHILYSQRKS